MEIDVSRLLVSNPLNYTCEKWLTVLDSSVEKQGAKTIRISSTILTQAEPVNNDLKPRKSRITFAVFLKYHSLFSALPCQS